MGHVVPCPSPTWHPSCWAPQLLIVRGPGAGAFTRVKDRFIKVSASPTQVLPMSAGRPEEDGARPPLPSCPGLAISSLFSVPSRLR